MSQQLKCSNKNNEKQNDQLPIKLAFQANILKYVQKKKREFSVFSDAKARQSQKSNHSSTSSNLINRNSDIKSNISPIVDSDMLLSARIKLLDRKTSYNCSNKKKKAKYHKSTLSDWRVLYDERNEIVEKHEMKKFSPDKMAVTDRLFYPTKKQSQSSLKTFCQKNRQKHHNPKDSNQQQYFVSDENFYHMYHRSVTPIASDLVERKRIVKYLKVNKQRRESRHGLRLMNEGIFGNLARNDVGFVPYKQQSPQSRPKLYLYNSPNINQNHIKNSSKRPSFSNYIQQTHSQQIARWDKSQIQKLDKPPRQPLYAQNQQDCFQSIQMLDPEKVQMTKKQQNLKTFNLSQMFSKTIDPNLQKRGQLKEIRLKLFKPRQNKIEKGIFNVKAAQTLTNFPNFDHYNPKSDSRKRSLNMTQLTISKWLK